MTPRAYRTRQVSASVSLDGVMVPLRAGEDGRAEASWREAACGKRFPSTVRQGFERLKTALSRPHAGERFKVTLKALASEANRRIISGMLRPDVRIVNVSLDAAADNWTFLETLSPETEVIDFCACLQTSPNGIRPCGGLRLVRERTAARFCVTTPVASTR